MLAHKQHCRCTISTVCSPFTAFRWICLNRLSTLLASICRCIEVQPISTHADKHDTCNCNYVSHPTSHQNHSERMQCCTHFGCRNKFDCEGEKLLLNYCSMKWLGRLCGATSRTFKHGTRADIQLNLDINKWPGPIPRLWVFRIRLSCVTVCVRHFAIMCHLCRMICQSLDARKLCDFDLIQFNPNGIHDTLYARCLDVTVSVGVMPKFWRSWEQRSDNLQL